MSSRFFFSWLRMQNVSPAEIWHPSLPERKTNIKEREAEKGARFQLSFEPLNSDMPQAGRPRTLQFVNQRSPFCASSPRFGLGFLSLEWKKS